MSRFIFFALLLWGSNSFADCRNPGNTGRSADIKCLACNCFHESKGERTEGQLGVLKVTMNRVADSRFPNKICSVVYERGQFQWAVSSGRDSKVSQSVPRGHECWKLAERARDGDFKGLRSPFSYIAFANKNLYQRSLRHDRWWKGMCRLTAIIGNHRFCGEGNGRTSRSKGSNR